MPPPRIVVKANNRRPHSNGCSRGLCPRTPQRTSLHSSRKRRFGQRFAAANFSNSFKRLFSARWRFIIVFNSAVVLS
jgi:hypothetical protein